MEPAELAAAVVVAAAAVVGSRVAGLSSSGRCSSTPSSEKAREGALSSGRPPVSGMVNETQGA